MPGFLKECIIKEVSHTLQSSQVLVALMHLNAIALALLEWVNMHTEKHHILAVRAYVQPTSFDISTLTQP